MFEKGKLRLRGTAGDGIRYDNGCPFQAKRRPDEDSSAPPRRVQPSWTFNLTRLSIHEENAREDQLLIPKICMTTCRAVTFDTSIESAPRVFIPKTQR